MNRFTDINNVQIEKALKENRILIIVLRRDDSAEKGPTPTLRNKFVLSKCQHVVSGYINKNGSIFPILSGLKNVTSLVDDSFQMASESVVRHERWTVAQDKLLLRMYYEDMGIHAIHKQLNRTYLAVYTRIRSITQPEGLLKGREFEDYILSLFKIQKGGALVLQEWQGDKTFGMVQPENNSNPDFVFRYNQEEFAVECKWRGNLESDLGKDVFSPMKRLNYKHFSESRRMPVTIILGVGGEPAEPELLYCIPLENLDDVVSGKLSIIRFLHPSRSFDISQFLFAKVNKDKAYTMEDKRNSHANAYKPWTKDNDELLKDYYNEGKSIRELSSLFKRNEGAILSRIKKLINKNQM